MKNRKPFLVPLSEPALAILAARKPKPHSKFLFGRAGDGYEGWSPMKKVLDEKINLKEPWVLHDFRRTFATIAGEKLGAQPHIADACLAHLLRGVTATYNRSTYLADKRVLLGQYAEYISRLVR